MAPTQRDFVRRGTGGNWTRDRNRAKLDEIAVNPRLLVSIADRDLSTTVLGHQISFPVMCAPAGGQCGSHPDGELATARAAGAAGTLMALPISSGYGLEEVADAATGPIWFQHIHYNDGVSEELLPRLKPAGYSAVVLTVDVLGPFPLGAHASPEPGDMAPMFGSLREQARPAGRPRHGPLGAAEHHVGPPRLAPLALGRPSARRQGHTERRGRGAVRRVRSRTASSSPTTGAGSSTAACRR